MANSGRARFLPGAAHVLLSTSNFSKEGRFYAWHAPLLLLRRNIRAVTGRAVFWSRLVEKYGLVFNGAGQLVASFATDVLMRPLERKCSLLVMVKQRRLPLCTVMALGARSGTTLDELPAVDVLMALFTL